MADEIQANPGFDPPHGVRCEGAVNHLISHLMEPPGLPSPGLHRHGFQILLAEEIAGGAARSFRRTKCDEILALDLQCGDDLILAFPDSGLLRSLVKPDATIDPV